MCGIAGIFDLSERRGDVEPLLQKMLSVIRHRGPDGSGVWCHGSLPLGLGHNRLSILDLKSTGSQPMTSQSGLMTLVLNGEIYNHQELRSDLKNEGFVFKGRSDTEVLLESIERFGLKSTLEKSVGMFSVALWDESSQSLYLIRDRFGEKPLYFHVIDQIGSSHLIFGSELKVITRALASPLRISDYARSLYFQYGYIPAPYSIYENVFKVEPGQIVKARLSDQGLQLSYDRFWDIEGEVQKAKSNLFLGSYEEAVEQSEFLIKKTIGLQKEADVAVGAFLSGGIDSTSIVSLFQEINEKKIKTFTIGFSEQLYDESAVSSKIATFLGSEHFEWIIHAPEAMNIIDKVIYSFDEPFSDSSQIPTLLVSQFARKEVKVALSGDGGDEFFGGYNRYIWGNKILNISKKIPKNMGNLLGKGIHKHHKILGQIYTALGGMRGGQQGISLASDKFRKLGLLLGNQDQLQMYRLLIQFDHIDEYCSLKTDERNLEGLRYLNSNLMNQLSFVEKMMFLDSCNYLIDDVLTKVDRSSMSVGLESRAPFLDHRIFSWVWSLPEDFKIRNGVGKPILRDLLKKRIPQSFMDRPKSGFAIPLADWLRGGFREWAESLLLTVSKHDFLHEKQIQILWKEHLDSKRDNSQKIWNILMYLSWYENHYLK